MLALHLAPVVIAGLLLAAHFFRADAWLGFAAALAVVAVAFVRRRWAPRIVQVGLGLGAIEWLRTMAMFAAERISFGQPYVRMVVILGAVTLLTALAALVFERRVMRQRYGLADDALLPAATQPGA
jgi:hypothetical protein